ncbi:uncharacterized protein LOC128896238 [Hylaeus anthracinus]|uniref:uncharacterized protein LOC128896238 n=1 Tax=Hylaeus anthracinus TaxID=313031 RepID=UPI0023B8ACE6|nr:uncharacterized protein LOC128896238 [Hylaeus anthracinus]
MSTQRSNENRRLSRSSSERVIFYTDNTSFETTHNPTDICQRSRDNDICPSENRSSRYLPYPDPNELQLNDALPRQLANLDDEPQYNVFTRSKATGQKQNRNSSELDQRSSRRSSVQSNRSRINSCSRPTSLGNGRRNSINKTTKPRKASTARRKDSVQPIKIVAKEAEKVTENAEDLEEARRHRKITMIILGTFLFLLAASILVVVVTLTQSSTFSKPSVGFKELAEHRIPRK